MLPVEVLEIDVANAPTSRKMSSRMLTSCTLPSVLLMNVGMLPCRSSRACILTALLRLRKLADGNSVRHRSMVVESSAYKLWSRSTPMGSGVYSGRAVRMSAAGRSVVAELNAAICGGEPKFLGIAEAPIDSTTSVKKSQLERIMLPKRQLYGFSDTPTRRFQESSCPASLPKFVATTTLCRLEKRKESTASCSFPPSRFSALDPCVKLLGSGQCVSRDSVLVGQVPP